MALRGHTRYTARVWKFAKMLFKVVVKRQSRKEKMDMKKIIFLVPFLLIFVVKASAGQAVYPVKVSENGRYLVDQQNDPVFWLGTTQWQIFREYTLEEARITIESIRKNGFSFIQAMLICLS